MSRRPERREKTPGTTEATLDNERMGRNSLQGDDQQHTRNERRSLPSERQSADALHESFDKLDKEKRAKEDLGKNVRKR